MAEKTRFEVAHKPKHPLGFTCEKCFHVVKDHVPGSKAMKCVRNPPQVQFLMQGGGQAIISVSPPVQPDDWCGEFDDRDAAIQGFGEPIPGAMQ